MDIQQQQKNFLDTLHAFYGLVNDVCSSYDGKKRGEIGMVKLTFLTLSERINRNIEGVIDLLEYNKDILERNRQPVMLLLRAVLEDLFVGTHLYGFKEKEESFKNELDVITLDYLKFSEFTIENEAYFEFADPSYKGKSLAERQLIVEQNLLKFKKDYVSFYDEATGRRKKPINLRQTSDISMFQYKMADGAVVNDDRKSTFNHRRMYDILIGLGIHLSNDEFTSSAYTFLLYKSLSQYQHFSFDISHTILNREVEFEMGLIHKCIRQIIVMINRFLQLLDMSENHIQKFKELTDKFIADFHQ